MKNRLDNAVKDAFKRYGNRSFITGPGIQLTFESFFERIKSIEYTIAGNINSFQKQNSIAILCDNKISSLLAILSALFLKIPYVPLDNLAPIKRNLAILKDNSISNLIISKSIFENISVHNRVVLKGFRKIALDDIDSFLLIRSIDNLDAFSNELAYILFTSGSTGKPKGIEISHNNAISFINWSKSLLPQNEELVFSSVAPFQFDLSVFDIYVSILSGGRMVLFENEDIRNPRLMTQLIDEYGINILYTTPTVFRLLWSYGKISKRSLSSLKYMIFAGEIMPYDLLDLMKQKCPLSQYYNFYGPTETNVCTYYNATNSNSSIQRNVPIGQCTPYATFKLDSSTNQKKGELLIAGESVFNGYLSDANLTSNSIKSIENKDWYCTGDIVEIDEDGQLNYLDRSDRMVKIKGYRIELNEIEKVILQMSFISNVAVILKKRNDETMILAYIELKDKSNDFNEIDVKNYCSDLLPNYMMPNSVILLDRIPINANSKTDYNTLSK